MEKKLFLIAVLCLCLINWKVNAQSKDIEAKYETSYNVELVSVSLNNNYKFFVIDNYEFEVSTTTNNIEIVVIKASGDANNYAKKFSGSNDNYYLIIYQNGEKINTSNVSIKINSTSKVLNVYKNNGKLLEKSNEKISLTANDYFFVITDTIDIGENNYVVTNNGNRVDNVNDIEISDDSVIEIYNSKDIKVDNTSVLGTNYKVIITTGTEVKKYVIIVKGDTTGDGKINLNDITRLYHYYKGIELMDECYVLAGDVASNQIINLNDVTKLYHYYKNIITSL